MKDRSRIGLYGGSFDPVHFGHINLAIELMERHSLDEVWFIPAHINPHKLGLPPVAAHHRIAMLKLAIDDIPSFSVKDFESGQAGPSYTVDTLLRLIEEEKTSAHPRKFFLLLGEDSLAGFGRWHRPEEIISLVDLLIGSRCCLLPESMKDESHAIICAMKKGMTKTPMMDISSTSLRLRLTKGLYCGHLIPHQVLDYIKQHRLY